MLDGRVRIIHGRFCCNRSSSGERRGPPGGGSLLTDLDAIDDLREQVSELYASLSEMRDTLGPYLVDQLAFLDRLSGATLA
jgi:hypothetical protein